MDEEAVQAAAEDLLYLRARWGHDVADAEVRRGSGILRRLLIEDHYGTAWRAIGLAKEPTLVAVDLDGVLEGTPPHVIECALAGGANFRGLMIASPMLLRTGQPPARLPSPCLTPDGYPGERVFALSRYLSSTAGVVNGRAFTRRDVIKYIAHIKHGVHAAAGQRKAERKLIDRLAKIERRIIVHQTDGLLVELVAIAQAIGRSADLQNFLSRLPASIRSRAEESLRPAVF